MVLTERTYARVALEDPERFWELHRGRLREKPTAMAYAHNRLLNRLAREFFLRLDPDAFEVRVNSVRVSRPEPTYYVPDLVVVPTALTRGYDDRPAALEVYAEPLPLVVEIWSPSTGGYDVDEKLPEYQRRGDREIWRLHPYERTLHAWRRQPDGTYAETVYRGGVVPVASLPGVAVDLDALFG